MKLNRAMIPWAVGVALALAGCDTEHEHTEGDGHSHESDGHSHGDAFDHTRCTGAEQTYEAGLEQLGEDGNLKLKLIGVDPDPPMVGTNRLTVQVMDADGTVIEDATFADTTNTWQHVHEHAGGSNGVATATYTGSDGVYEVSEMKVIHPGSWEFRFDVTAGGVTDRIVYHFCVTEGGTDGTDGPDGHDGTDGHDSHDGTNGTHGTDHPGGTDGTDHTDGTDGTDHADHTDH